MPVHLGHQMADMDRIMAIATRHGLAVVEDCAHAPGQRWRDRGAGCIGDFGSFSHQSSKILTAGEGGSLLTNDDRLAGCAHSLIDCGRPKDADEKEYTFGANYRLGELHAALLRRRDGPLPRSSRPSAQSAGRRFEELVRGEVPGCACMPHDERITRWSFYNYILAIEPEAFAGRTQRGGLRRAGGRGGPARGPATSRCPATSCSSRRCPACPVAVEFADRLDPARMSFPVAEAAGLRESVYFMRTSSATGSGGVDDAVEALAKVQRHADELPNG